MRKLLISSLCLALLAACGDKPAPTPPAAPPAAPAMGPKTPPAGMPPAAGVLTGKVAEKLDAGTYSYLRLETAGGEVWAAVPVTDTAVGAQVSIQNPMSMDGFESKTLNRVFAKIVFGTLAPTGGAAPAPGAAPAAPAAPVAGMPPMPPMGAPRAGMAAPVEDIQVAKAEGAGAVTVAEIFSGKAGLADKKIKLHAKVVKYSGGILGKNWLHVRDGSGTAAASDHDITVTTTQVAAVGDVVLVEGVVHLDKDFGAGYAYPVLIEEATVTKTP